MVQEDIQSHVYRGAPWGQREVCQKIFPCASSFPFHCWPPATLEAAGGWGYPATSVWNQLQTSLLAFRNAFLVFPSHFILHFFFFFFLTHCHTLWNIQFHSFPLCEIPSTLTMKGPVWFSFTTSCSVGKLVKSGLTLCDPMGYSMPGLYVHYLLEFAEVHVHWVSDDCVPI